MAEITSMANGQLLLTAYIDYKLSQQAILDALMSAVDDGKKLIAKRFWEEHEGEIMAKMDIQGLANLIALYAHEDLQKIIALERPGNEGEMK